MPSSDELNKVLIARQALVDYFKTLDYRSTRIKKALDDFPNPDDTGDALKNEMTLLLRNENANEPEVIDGINELGMIAATYNEVTRMVHD